MKNFKSLEEYIEITQQSQSKGVKNINCYLMPNEITELIDENRLFYIKNHDTLQIMVKRDRYFKVYLYGNEEFRFESFETDLPILIDIPYSIKMNSRLLEFKEKLEQQGFILNSTTTRMSCPIFDADCKLGDFVIEDLHNDQIEEVYNIWEENFDPIQNLLYSKEEIKNCKNKIYILKENDNVLGAMEIVLNGTNGWVQHIAIKRECQGRGLGGILESFYINYCKSLGIKTLLLYTIDSNVNAQRFHTKFGFIPDGKYNCQFIFRS